MYTHVHCKCVHWLLPDKDETKPDMLRSILAQLDYTYLVNSWTAKGVPFNEHLYVPEIHPCTRAEFCKREDEGHVLKVCVCVCVVWCGVMWCGGCVCGWVCVFIIILRHEYIMCVQ